jgi:hypothetical protein
MTSAVRPKTIRITVTFALAAKPYKHEYDPKTTVGAVLQDALVAFHTTTDGTTTFELLHDGAVVAPSQTVGEVAEHAHELRVSLRTVNISG